MTGVGPIAALKESLSLLRKTWGEQIVGAGGLALLVADTPLLLIVVLVLGFLLFIALILISGALSGIDKAAIYQYFNFAPINNAR